MPMAVHDHKSSENKRESQDPKDETLPLPHSFTSSSSFDLAVFRFAVLKSEETTVSI